mmetsp:Transcript_22059/g.72005  ORF Transcript_22059/g.72005 Transcript_22059/m.72005 type:complete len:127 (+) Transcript_22059:380-760(+)
MTCPVTCSLSAEATSGHLEPDATPSDYGERLPPAATAAICSTCADHPDLPCCHDHPHEGDDRRRLQSSICTAAYRGTKTTNKDKNKDKFTENKDKFNCASREIWSKEKKAWCDEQQRTPPSIMPMV